MANSNYSQIVSLHQMWETFNPELIKEIVSVNIFYTSDWVLKPIRGKEKFLYYIEKKLQTIKDAVGRNEISIHSKVVKTNCNIVEHYLILTHIIEKSTYESLISVSVKDGLIIKMGIGPIKERFKLHLINESTE